MCFGWVCQRIKCSITNRACVAVECRYVTQSNSEYHKFLHFPQIVDQVKRWWCITKWLIDLNIIVFFLFFYGSSSTCRIRRERLLIKQYNACGLAFCMYILFCFLVQDRSNNLWYDQMLHWISSWSSPVILRNVFFYIALGPVSGKL